jgi:phage tail sheath protein FI
MIKTTIDYACDESAVTIKGIDDPALSGTLAGLKAKDPAHYQEAINAVRNLPVLLPVSPAVAGIYALVDTNRGVWKAPANVNINYAAEPLVHLSDAEQDELNIDGLTGKSINAVRRFPGHGPAIIWGARTLAGNNNEWRYIPVRRFFIMVEGSVRKATSPFVFETNNNETWLRIKTMIKNYLSMQWRSGALAGAKPEHAFYVKLGLGETMTTQDILDGKMIIEIGMAVLRPAEFIIMHLTHQMLAT